eukprot:6212581-Pleurochrysis_carterae.AAC.4
MGDAARVRRFEDGDDSDGYVTDDLQRARRLTTTTETIDDRLTRSRQPIRAPTFHPLVVIILLWPRSSHSAA